MTPEQKRVLDYLDRHGDRSLYAADRKAGQQCRRKGWIENTGRTNGIANTIGGVQWQFRITELGRRVLKQAEAP